MSEIKSDEEVLFFPTAARLSDDGRSWVVPIHGWVFEPEEDSRLRASLLDRLMRTLARDVDRGGKATARRRLRWFLVDNERGKRIGIRVGRREFILPASGKDGHFHGEIRISAESAAALTTDGRLAFAAITRNDDPRRFDGYVQLVSRQGVSVVSDIDDTIKVSEVTDRRKLIANTFFRPFQAVDGMADLYRRWAEEGHQFHFVSSSPWQLYVPLSSFMRDAGFPPAAFHLKQLRLKDTSVLEIAADPLATKPPLLEAILSAYPQRRFLFVGDSGEKDPEVYGIVARRHADQVLGIYIRDVTGEPRDASRYEQAFRDVPAEKWKLFTDGSEL
jgi:hypothetical protein